MAHNPNHNFDRETHDALEVLALEPSEESLRAPIDDQDRIQLLNFNPQTFARLKITVQPDLIHVERESGESFGIADHSYDLHNPVSVLGRAVAGLTLERHDGSWAVRQHPDWLVHVDNPASFGLFWRVLASYVQSVRAKRAQTGETPTNQPI